MSQLNGLKPVPALSGEQIARTVARTLDSIESSRRDLAQLYALAEGGTTLEHEVGECLTKLRAAAKRIREAFASSLKWSCRWSRGPSMRALTLTQPWATLVALGEKRYETRSWSTPYRGLLAIHAAKGFPKSARSLTVQPPFSTVLAAHETHLRDLPLGTIVAVAELRHVIPTDRFDWPPLSTHERAFGDYSRGRFAWELAFVRRLREPIPAVGKLGLWEWAPPAPLYELLVPFGADMDCEVTV